MSGAARGLQGQMSRVVNAWVQLNRDARKVCRAVLEALLALEGNDAPRHVCAAFLSKATDTLSAVNVLYAHRLEEPAQALIRVLFELRVNFDCFRQMASRDPSVAFSRLRDSMMLEKIKQARAAQFVGIPKEVIEMLGNDEKEIAKRYSPEELRQMRKHGFTGIPIEQRASMNGHEAAYAVVYRNFSRNVHATDYMESYLKSEIYEIRDLQGYLESRDVAAHYTAHFSAVGIAEVVNGMFDLDFDEKLDELGQRQKGIKKEFEPAVT